MSKRKFEGNQIYNIQSKRSITVPDKKHSLDSDEEDETQDSDNVLDENDIEGEEDFIPGAGDTVHMTAFNMREEMEEGHFDKDGHFIWKNEKEIRDNWLDNIDWQNAKTYSNHKDEDKTKSMGDDSDSEDDFQEIETYKNILTYLKPKETINKAICRLGGGTKKLSSIERLQRKKAGTLGSNEEITKLTELANSILNKTGNMDVYQESFETITLKVKASGKKQAQAKEPELDMYADDFDDKEKVKLGDPGPSQQHELAGNSNVVLWEYKIKRDDETCIGPFTTEQMIVKKDKGDFKTSVLIRKCGEFNFYSSDRIDFDLYI